MKFFPWFLLVIAAAVAGIYAMVVLEPADEAAPQAPAAATSTLAATFVDPIRGAPTAPVTIIEFGDYTCGACKSAEATLAEVLAAHPTARLVWKDFPLENLSQEAVRAAEAAHCAQDQGKFWEFHDRLLAEDRPLSPFIYSELARALELDALRFESCLSSGKKRPLVLANRDAGISAGVSSLPAFFINGTRLADESPAGFDAAIRAAEL